MMKALLTELEALDIQDCSRWLLVMFAQLVKVEYLIMEFIVCLNLVLDGSELGATDSYGPDAEAKRARLIVANVDSLDGSAPQLQNKTLPVDEETIAREKRFLAAKLETSFSNRSSAFIPPDQVKTSSLPESIPLDKIQTWRAKFRAIQQQRIKTDDIDQVLEASVASQKGDLPLSSTPGTATLVRGSRPGLHSTTLGGEQQTIIRIDDTTHAQPYTDGSLPRTALAADEAAVRPILARERRWRTRVTVLQSQGKTFYENIVLGILRNVIRLELCKSVSVEVVNVIRVVGSSGPLNCLSPAGYLYLSLCVFVFVQSWMFNLGNVILKEDSNGPDPRTNSKLGYHSGEVPMVSGFPQPLTVGASYPKSAPGATNYTNTGSAMAISTGQPGMSVTNSALPQHHPQMHCSRYDQGRFASGREETAGFRIDTMATYHGKAFAPMVTGSGPIVGLSGDIPATSGGPAFGRSGKTNTGGETPLLHQETTASRDPRGFGSL
ncbi:hypothetical protein EG68_09403 [Paragonimus skrjabini miyazakii]|uniref:Paf1 complex subunit Cdc73 N-terminal domain-containing protein n=1 Tax=Paragonimus skrjabini miyazakii TaxID=59628 RepID=A0A8S9YCE6_9TREM|nr:hypothetical protein EG68_09403 [Paragonimus skrjabini miyazakii]